MELIKQKLEIAHDMADPHLQVVIKLFLEYIEINEDKGELGFKTNEKSTN